MSAEPPSPRAKNSSSPSCPTEVPVSLNGDVLSSGTSLGGPNRKPPYTSDVQMSKLLPRLLPNSNCGNAPPSFSKYHGLASARSLFSVGPALNGSVHPSSSCRSFRQLTQMSRPFDPGAPWLPGRSLTKYIQCSSRDSAGTL